MKHAVPVSVAILLAAFLGGWWLDGRLAAARAEERSLTAKAAAAGISTVPGRPTRSRRPDRAALDAEAEELAAAYLASPRARQRIDMLSHEVASEAEKRIAGMDARQWKVFLTTVLAAIKSDPSIDVERVMDHMQTLGGKDPQAALALFAEHRELFGRQQFAYEIVSIAIYTWAKDDPSAAARWIKDNAASVPEALSFKTLGKLFETAAKRDPALAFAILDTFRLDEDKQWHALNRIVTAAFTDEARNAALSGLRAYRNRKPGDKTTGQLVDQMTGHIARTFSDQDFDAATGWIASAKLNPKERTQILGEVIRNYKGDEQGRWLQWLGENEPAGSEPSLIVRLASDWTERDYEAVARWLDEAPEGPAKSSAILGYVWAMAEYDPETAIQWVGELPPGRERDAALRRVHDRMPKETDAEKQAAEAFASEHGIE